MQTRDYLHVDDAAAAFLAAGRSAATGTLNISTGRETAVCELAERLRVSVTYAPQRHGEIERSCLSPAAARRTLGWQAQVTLEDGLRRLRVPAPTLQLT